LNYDVVMAETLEVLWGLQGGKCYLTGLPLVLGHNDAVDHVRSRRDHPELARDMRNLRWCERNFNRLKGTMTIEELLTFARSIIEREEEIRKAA
jgi:5-methylcytosine-specific restriction endonuclease McrA